MDKIEILNRLCESYNSAPAFIPTAQIIHKMITKAAFIKNEEQILNTINPKEKKRRLHEKYTKEPVDLSLCELRVTGG